MAFSSQSPRISSLPGKEIVIRGLLKNVIEGRWKGGHRLTEGSAVACFGVSRTPVREAFLALQGLGIVDLRRNCGAAILPFGPDELRDLYAVRSLLEVEASRLASPEMDRSAVERMIGEFEGIKRANGADPEWRHDRELHRLIASTCGNRRLEAEISRYGDLVQAMREIVGGRTFEIHSTSVDEHLAILRALSRGDSVAAGEAMRAHLEQASDSAIAALVDLRASL